MSKYGQKIQKARLALGLKQHELALIAGITPTSLSKIEKGRRVPMLPTMESLAKALRVSVEDLLDINVRPLKLCPSCREIQKLHREIALLRCLAPSAEVDDDTR